MFRRALPSKAAFLLSKVMPANDEDAFNDNKCTFCWGPYDEEHPGVRILPCNHVFGQDCLCQIINAPNGDYCPICRTPLFQPPLDIAIERLLGSLAERFALCLFAVVHKLLVITHKLSEMTNALPLWIRSCFKSQWLRFIFRLWLCADNVYFPADLLVTHFTDLRTRNPGLKLKVPREKYQIILASGWGVRKCFGLQDNPMFRILQSIFVVVLFSLIGTHGKLSNNRDRFVFTGIMLIALIIHFHVISLMWCSDKLTR